MLIKTEKTEFKIPPCQVDKDLIKKIGEIFETQSPTVYNEIFAAKEAEMRKEDYYKKYPENLTEDEVRRRIPSDAYEPKYSLVSSSRNIESSNVNRFVDAEWPTNVEAISISLGYWEYAKKIEVQLFLKSWRMDDSRVAVSGLDGVWVNGVATSLGAVFKERKLSYHSIVTHLSLRILLSIAAWISLAFAVLYPLWGVIRPLLREGIKFEFFFAVIASFGGLLALYPLTLFLTWLFPRFEYGRGSTARQLRKWIWGLLVSSGLVAAVLLKLLGL